MKKLPAPYAEFIEATAQATHLPAEARFNEAWHCWSDAERRAVIQAWASERPLLVRGEAGSGKSQLARALAALLGVPLEMEVIHPRFEATDLKYREDPVRRLAQAQVLGALRPASTGPEQQQAWIEAQLDPAKFVSQGAIWRAFAADPPADDHRQPRHIHWPRAVLLIDEVDKADADVPHALLDVLGNRSFNVPATGGVVSCDAHWPLIVITTNEDRELPQPFVRRCAVLNLKPPSQDTDEGRPFVDWLVERARVHRGLAVLDTGDDAGSQSSAGRDTPPNPLRAAALQTLADRRTAAANGLPTVGLAEYLDLLYSLRRLSGGDSARAMSLLDELSAFALVKQREQDQQRAAEPR
jgi:MoxR-like ATPase